MTVEAPKYMLSVRTYTTLAQVFCGNFEYDASEKDIAKLFEKYGPVERIDMKTGEQHVRGPQSTNIGQEAPTRRDFMMLINSLRLASLGIDRWQRPAVGQAG
jgi:hypothetical protein